jgi:glycosyltransferase involved in cell wall biosynthesis
LKEGIARFGPDVIHFHTLGQLSPSAILAAGNIPSVLTVHGPEEFTTQLLKWYLPPDLFKEREIVLSKLTLKGVLYFLYHSVVQRPLYKYGFRRNVAIMIAPSVFMSRVLKEEKLGVPVRQIYNGIDLPECSSIESKERILFVGRLEHVKGVDVLLEAFAVVRSRLAGAQLDIVGAGSMSSALEIRAKRLGIENSVHFHGWLTGSELRSAYRDSTLVVVPSIWPENFPTVCLEALAIGRPVVCSNTGGLPELVTDYVTGRVVPANQAEPLADAIVEVCRDSDLPEMSARASESVSRFSVERFVSELLGTYAEVQVRS